MNQKMFRPVLFIVAILTIAVWNTATWAQMGEPGKKASVSSPADEAEQHFRKAHEDFLKRDRKAAAEEIRKAAVFLKRQERRATSEGKKDLSASVRELERLAAEVQNGTVTSVRELDRDFARADYALAEHHILKASESWTKKETEKAGRDLATAADYLDRGLSWAGSKADAGTASVIRDARMLGRKLIKGTRAESGEVGKGIENLGRKIRKFAEAGREKK